MPDRTGEPPRRFRRSVDGGGLGHQVSTTGVVTRVTTVPALPHRGLRPAAHETRGSVPWRGACVNDGMASRSGRTLAVGALVALGIACSVRGVGAPDAGADGPVAVPQDGGPCVAGRTQCTNCKDDDSDGVVDALDPECTGPLDDDESSFGTGIPGDNKDPCQEDCFFDGNSGVGDDGCRSNLACDPASPGSPKCPHDPKAPACSDPQTQACRNACVPLAPNGCDCFGCCEVPSVDAGVAFIKLDPSCTAQTMGDPTRCKPCTRVQDCLNPCDRCELCVGKSALPSDCAIDGGTGPVCPYNEISCDANVPCAVGFYCLTGCCIPDLK